MRKVRNIPVPGMRVIKTALAVFLCLTIVGMLGEHYSGYSAIVAIVCMQKDLDNSVTMAINRSVGTLVGAAFGVLTYKLMEFLPANSGYVLPYLIVAVMMVLLMVVIISLGKQAATAVTCIIFLSVAVLRNSEIDVWYFVFHRMIDTFIGIGISLLVNITLTEETLEKFHHNNSHKRG